MGRPIHSGIVLPGDIARSGGGLTIHVPRGYETAQDQLVDPNGGGGHICRVVVDGQSGAICGEVFDLDREGDYLRHLRTCVAQHRDEIHAASPRTRNPILDPNSWDPEVAAHMHEVGRRMKAERRLEVKPSERAGF